MDDATSMPCTALRVAVSSVPDAPAGPLDLVSLLGSRGLR
jgi:hypothetical protein